jgi:hypothetical protein
MQSEEVEQEEVSDAGSRRADATLPKRGSAAWHAALQARENR